MKNEISSAGNLIKIIENSRNNALKKVNEELIRMYWKVGKYLSKEAEKAAFGDAYIDSVVNEIQSAFPGIKGFNRRGLYRMKQFYETYCGDEFVSALLTQISWTIIAVFVVLLLSLKSISLPVILVLSIETAIWLNLAIPYFRSSTIFYIAYLIISSIQLGATVDYAILMTDRYRENRQIFDKKAAVIQTISDVTVSILTSGSVLTVVGLLLGYVSTNQLLAQLGIFIGRGAILSLTIVLFVLPGLLFLFDRLVSQENRKTHRKEKNHKKLQEGLKK